MKYKLKISSDILNNNHIINQYDEDNLPYCEKPDIINSIYDAIEGEIKAEDIIENTFPSTKPHIFISHSHKDEKIAIKLANFIFKKFGIISFIDSMFWNHLEEPTKKLHIKHCKIDGSTSFDYNKSNKLLEHMHSILSISLLNAMNNSDCVLFIESENSTYDSSISYPSSYNVDITISPWIFNEISYANILKEKRHDEIEKILDMLQECSKEIKKSRKKFIINEAMENYSIPKILYKVDFTKFVEISEAKLHEIISLNVESLKALTYYAGVNLTLIYGIMGFYEDEVLKLIKDNFLEG